LLGFRKLSLGKFQKKQPKVLVIAPMSGHDGVFNGKRWEN